MKEQSRFAKFVKILLVVAAVSFVAVKIYQKFFAKKKNALEENESDEVLQPANASEEDTPAFDVAADTVIDNVENMNAETESNDSAVSEPEA